MAIPVSCPQCSASFPVSEELLGKKMRCRSCQHVFIGQAAPVKVGARSSDSPSPRGTNGVHAPSKSSTDPKPADKSAMFAFVGIGTGIALMLLVTVWAVFLRGSKTETPVVPDSPTVAKINVSDPVKEIATPTPDPEKPKEPAKVETAEKPKITMAKFDEVPRNFPYRIEPGVEERVKKSAAWIKVITEDGGGGNGSGWMAEPGIMITNAHVIGMKGPAAKAPATVKCVFNSGLKSERTCDAKILGVDRDNDLAVLKVFGDDLPDPIPIRRSSEMVEGQHLYVVGFPYANTVAKVFADDNHTLETTIKVRQSTVVGRMPTKTGSIKLVQIEGGADPGNSGSMIVDTLGFVRLIHVMGYGPALKFSIPSEYAVYLLQGRMLSIVPSQPVADGGVVRQKLAAMVADPMSRIQGVALDLWVGEPGKKVRPASESPPESQSGDGSRQTIEMTYDPNSVVPIGSSREATGEWKMPELSAGQVYWVQPKYTTKEGKVRWGEAVVMDTAALPAQQKSATLAIRHKAGDVRRVHIESHIGISAGPEEGTLHLSDNGIKLDLTEKTLSVLPNGDAKTEFSYNELRPTDEDEDFQFKQLMRGMLDTAKGLVTQMQVSKRGLIRMPKPDMKKIPIAVRPILERFNDQTIQSLEALSLALPDREVKPGEKWQHDQNYTVAFGRQLTENALFKMTYQMVGTRVRNGREEAVIEFEGNIVRGEGMEASVAETDFGSKGGKGKDKNARLRVRGMYGTVRGAALVDVATGLTAVARTTGNLEFEVPYVGQILKFAAALRIDIQREITPGLLTKNPLQILPNQEMLLNPFVGSPDHKLTLGASGDSGKSVASQR